MTNLIMIKKEAESFKNRVRKEIEETGADWDLACCRVQYAELQTTSAAVSDTYRSSEEDHWRKDFCPVCVQGHNPGGCYWIMPVRVRDGEKIEPFKDVKEFDHYELSVDIDYFEPLLRSFFIEGFNPDLNINRHRFSCVENPEGVFIKGFEWYVHYNFYTYEDIRRVANRLQRAADDLNHHDIHCLSERELLHLLIGCRKLTGAKDVPDEILDRISVFYIEVNRYLLNMIEQCRDASVIAVALF